MSTQSLMRALSRFFAVRTLLMTQKGNSNGSTWSVFRDTRGLYRGFGVVAALSFPAHALYFMGYEESKRRIGGDSTATHLAAGFLADVAGSLVWVPNDVVKQRCQVSPGIDSWTMVKRIVRGEGVMGLYRGYGASLAVYGPFVSIYFAGYEWSKARIPGGDSFWGQIVSGAFGATVASALTNPVDVVKTRLQVDLSYTGVLDCVKRTLREEGMNAMHKGLVARIMWLTPSCALSIAVFEQVKSVLTSRMD
jgi:hypothetical protein